jgi:glycosyltransferase involved in cell wall biosynthesis
MSMPRVSAAMIVRDEEAVLEECLRSIRDEVDEIVITDTGSTDRSREIAAAFGARVLQRRWDDDFSVARNHSLEAATGDFILYIDADERLDAACGGTLRRTIEQAPRCAAFLLLLQPRVGFTSYLEGRLFRRDSRVRFTGRIHERIWPGIEALCEAENLSVERCAARILHVGYEGDLRHKHRRNLPLLQRAVTENPERVYCWWHLGETLAALGRREEAETTLRKAIQVARRSKKPAERFEASLAYQTLARIAFDADEDALPVIEEGLAVLPEDYALQFMKARALINSHSHEVALGMLDRLIAVNSTDFINAHAAYDRRIFSEFALDLKGVALLRLQRFVEASVEFNKAAQVASEQDRLRYRAKAAAAVTRGSEMPSC